MAALAEFVRMVPETMEFEEFHKPTPFGVSQLKVPSGELPFDIKAEESLWPMDDMMKKYVSGGSSHGVVINKKNMIIRLEQQAHIALVNPDQAITVDQTMNADLVARLNSSTTVFEFVTRPPTKEETHKTTMDPAYFALSEGAVTDRSLNAIKNIAVLQGIDRAVNIDISTREMLQAVTATDMVHIPLLVRMASLYISAKYRELMQMNFIVTTIPLSNDKFVNLDVSEKAIEAARAASAGVNIVYLPVATSPSAIEAMRVVLGESHPDQTFEVSKMWPPLGRTRLLAHKGMLAQQDHVVHTLHVLDLITAYCNKYNCWSGMQAAFDLALTTSCTRVMAKTTNVISPSLMMEITLPALDTRAQALAPLSTPVTPMVRGSFLSLSSNQLAYFALVKASMLEHATMLTWHNYILNPYDTKFNTSKLDAAVSIKLTRGASSISAIQHATRSACAYLSPVVLSSALVTLITPGTTSTKPQLAVVMARSEFYHSSVHLSAYTEKTVEGTTLSALMTRFSMKSSDFKTNYPMMIKVKGATDKLAACAIASSIKSSQIVIRAVENDTNIQLASATVNPPRIPGSTLLTDTTCNNFTISKGMRWVFGLRITSQDDAFKLARLAASPLEWQLYLTGPERARAMLDEGPSIYVTPDEAVSELISAAVEEIVAQAAAGNLDEATATTKLANILEKAGCAHEFLPMSMVVEGALPNIDKTILARVLAIHDLAGGNLSELQARSLLLPLIVVNSTESNEQFVALQHAMADKCAQFIDPTTWTQLSPQTRILAAEMAVEALRARKSAEEDFMAMQLESQAKSLHNAVADKAKVAFAAGDLDFEEAKSTISAASSGNKGKAKGKVVNLIDPNPPIGKWGDEPADSPEPEQGTEQHFGSASEGGQEAQVSSTAPHAGGLLEVTIEKTA